MNLQDKRVLITGGTSGIGLATAEALIAKDANVFITGRRNDALSFALERLRASGRRVEGLTADAATEQGRKFTVKGCIDALGGIDILINNAGGVRAGRLEDTTEDEITAMVMVRSKSFTRPISVSESQNRLTELALRPRSMVKHRNRAAHRGSGGAHEAFPRCSPGSRWLAPPHW